MPTKLEVKASGALHDVEHSTLKTNSGAMLGNFKAEYYPPFRLAGRVMEFQLSATEQTVLRPKAMADLAGQFKLYALDKLPVTVKYFPGKKVVGCTAKLNHSIAHRSCQTEVKWATGKAVGTECEMRVDDHNKIQVETLGQQCDSVKWTLEKGLQQLKLKMIVPGRQFVLGVDSIVGSQKFDLEYNVSNGQFIGKSKIWPMTLQATTVANQNGVKPITWKVTMDRAWIV